MLTPRVYPSISVDWDRALSVSSLTHLCEYSHHTINMQDRRKYNYYCHRLYSKDNSSRRFEVHYSIVNFVVDCRHHCGLWCLPSLHPERVCVWKKLSTVETKQNKTKQCNSKRNLRLSSCVI